MLLMISGNVRVIPYNKGPVGYTGNASHLIRSCRKNLYGTMEEGLYEVDVKTLKAKMFYQDSNVNS